MPVMTNSEDEPQYLRDFVEDAIGKKSSEWKKPDCGLSPALRFSVALEDKSRVFVKAATDEQTEQWLRTEYLVLSSIREKFMPYVVDWLDKPGTRPVLITQDLSHAYWPASHAGVVWRDGDFDLLFKGIKKLSSFGAPPLLPTFQNRSTSLWAEIADNAEGFLNLKLCSERWFRDSIDALIEAEKKTDKTGDRLVHGDIRSDNICFVDSQILFVDWSHAGRGNRFHDLGRLLPSLHLEGGPVPYQVMPDGGGEAAFGSSELIRRILAETSMPEWLNKVFKKLISIELEWAASCLRLEKPDGIPWQAI
jgi:hypothetical protein